MPSTSCDHRCTYQVVFTKDVHQVNFERLFCSLVNPTLTMRMVFTACVVTSSSLRSDVSYNSVRATIIAVPHERQEVVVSWKSTFPIQQVAVASMQAARPLSPCWSSTGSRVYYGEVLKRLECVQLQVQSVSILQCKVHGIARASANCECNRLIV